MEIPESSSLSRSEDEIALQGCFSPKKGLFRFLGLALMCLLGFGKFPFIIICLHSLLYTMQIFV